MPDESRPTPTGGMTIWPCDHGNVEVEPGFIPRGTRCHQCGAAPEHYVPASRLTEAEQRIEELTRAGEEMAGCLRRNAISDETTDAPFNEDASQALSRWAALGSTEEPGTNERTQHG